MADKVQPPTPETKTPAEPAATPPSPPAPRRGPGHRGADVRDTVAEMAARAQEISQEAGSKVAAAMKDVISAAAGLAGFAVESARDLVQYMVRRGQMTQEEADKLIREAEEAVSKRGGSAPPTPRPAAPVRAIEPQRPTPAAKKVVPTPKAVPAPKKAAAGKARPSRKRPAQAASRSSSKRKAAAKPKAKSPPKKGARKR